MFEYATLAEMARQGGDLSFSDVGTRSRRLMRLEKQGLVVRKANLGRYELTPKAWRLVTDAEAAYALSKEG